MNITEPDGSLPAYMIDPALSIERILKVFMYMYMSHIGGY